MVLNKIHIYQIAVFPQLPLISERGWGGVEYRPTMNYQRLSSAAGLCAEFRMCAWAGPRYKAYFGGGARGHVPP